MSLKGDLIYMNKIKHEIQEALLELGVPANLMGFSYIAYAEELVFQDENYMHQMTNWLYVDVAKHYHTKARCVERCMRKAIVTAWQYGNPEWKAAVFKNSVNPIKGIPTNSQFIARMYFYLAEKLESEEENEKQNRICGEIGTWQTCG